MEKEKIKGLQDLSLHMMKIIHEICVNNNIKYYIIGGTTLGSKRHQGFIPWDVDVDIAMLREDYKVFKELALRELPNTMQYVDYTIIHNHRSPHALVLWKNSKVIEAKDGHEKQIHVDIFPLDYAPQNRNLQTLQARSIKFLKRIKATKLLSQSKHLNVIWYKYILFKGFRIINPFINIDSINRQMDCIMQRYNNQEYPQLICSMASHYSYKKQCMPIEIYGKPTLMKFEDSLFWGPEQTEVYLKKIYGDYMVLPPKSERDKMLNLYLDAEWIE